MFRRKDENLFDTTTDPNYAPMPADPMDNLTSASAMAASAPAGNGNSNGASSISASSVIGSSAASGSILSRQTSDSRPASTQTTTNFRPNASPAGNELTRSRPSDAKPASTASAAPTSIAIDKSMKAGRRVLTVGNDILLKGEIATCDRLVIEGKVDATLNDVHTVEISESGSFKGSAQIEDAEISGLFEGDLIVRNRLVIYATGKVRGKITYGEIEIERGGELTGEIKTVSAGSQPTSARHSRPIKETVAA